MSKMLRRVFITWNNWEDDFTDKDEVVKHFELMPHFRGARLGFEVGKKGTPHIQGIVFFTHPKRFSTLLGDDYFKKNHIEQVLSLKGSLEYVSKEGDYIDIGEIPLDQGKRTDITDFKDAIVEGMTDLELLENYTSQYLRYEPMIDKIRQLANNEYYSKNNRDINCFYIGGLAGSGKTSMIYELFDTSQVYRVGNYKNPFDHYKGQKILVLDEYNGQIKDDLMLNILDRYPLLLPARYNDKWAVFDTVLILSNYRYDSVFQRSMPAIKQAFDRRFTYIDYMNFDNREKIKQTIQEKLDALDLAF